MTTATRFTKHNQPATRRADVAADVAAYDAHLEKIATAQRFAPVETIAKAAQPTHEAPGAVNKRRILQMQGEIEQDIAKLASTAKLSRAEATVAYLKSADGREKYNTLDKHRELTGIYEQRPPEGPAADAPIAKSAHEQKLDTLIAKHATDHKVSRPAATAAVLKTTEGQRLYAEANAPVGAR